VKLHKFIFQALVLLLPVQLAFHYWPDWALVAGVRVDYLAPTLFLTDLIFLLLLYTSLSEIFTKNRSLFIKLFIISIPLLFIYTRDALSIYESLKILEFIYLSIYVKTFVAKDTSLITKPLRISVIITILIAVLQVITRGSLGGIFYFLGERDMFISDPGIARAMFFGHEFLRPYSIFPHPNAFAGYLLVSFFLLKKYKFTRLFILLGLFLTYSQNVWLALSIIYLVKAINEKFVFVVNWVALFLGLIFSLTLPIISYQLISQGNLFAEFIQKRLELSVIAGYLIARNPVLGVGLGRFIPLIPDVINNVRILSISIWWLQPVHNVYLLVVSETGFLGFFILTTFLIKLIVNKNIILSFILLAILITGLIDHYWLTLQQTRMLLAIVSGLLLSKNVDKINFV